MNKKTVLAFDIGTGSGRGILGYWDEEKGLEKIEEIYRFENGFIQINDGYYWDHLHIYREIINCLKKCSENNIQIDSIGIDTWAQDYAYIGDGGEPLGYVRAYRDPIFDEIGIATQDRLVLDEKIRPKEKAAAHCFLFLAYLLVQMLTGEEAYDESETSIAHMMPNPLLPKRMEPGEIIGYTGKAVLDQTGYDRIPVACTLAHDTASAVYSIPDRENFMWNSSGSFAMMGIVTEGKVLENEELAPLRYVNTALDGNRICPMHGSGTGMYHIQQCMKKWKADGIAVTYSELTEYAVKHKTDKCIDLKTLDETTADMPAEINRQLKEDGFEEAKTPEEIYEVFCNSLAREVADSLLGLEAAAGLHFDKIYIIGGGSQADGVSLRIKAFTGKEIYAGITEASAIGNILAQLKAVCGKDITSGKLLEMRKL